MKKRKKKMVKSTRIKGIMGVREEARGPGKMMTATERESRGTGKMMTATERGSRGTEKMMTARGRDSRGTGKMKTARTKGPREKTMSTPFRSATNVTSLFNPQSKGASGNNYTHVKSDVLGLTPMRGDW